MKLIISIVLLLSFLLTACGTPEQSGRQIVFQVLDGKFTSLKIDGRNPNEQKQIWDKNFDSAQSQVLTEGFWWRGTAVLFFNVVNVGERSCVIDNILEAKGEGQMVVVIYTEGKGCTGEGGSAREPGSERVLYQYLEGDDGYELVEAAGFAVDSAECLQGIAEALATKVNFRVIRACGSAVKTGVEETAQNAVDTITEINKILTKYDLQIADQPSANDDSVPTDQEPTSVSQLATISFGPHVPVLSYDPTEWEESEIIEQPILFHRNFGCRLDAFGGLGGQYPNAVTYTARIGSIEWVVTRLDTLGPIVYGTNPGGPFDTPTIVYNMQVGNNPDECMKAAENILLLSEQSIKDFIGP
jgi:hypothetical protein